MDLPRLAFYSTLRFPPWGAPDVLWARAALLALRKGHAVFAAVRDQILHHPEIEALRAAGAEIHRVPDIAYGGNAARLTVALRNVHRGAAGTLRRLRAFRPDTIVINQGGFYDFVSEKDLFALIDETACRYLILAHSNRESEVMSPSLRALAVKRLRGARRLLAISVYTLQLAERQLLVRLENGSVFQNPLDLPAALPLPWPVETAVGLAVVSRLDAHGKGLDILLGALQEGLGLQTDWRLNIYGDGPDRDYLENLARWEGVAERVRFHGYVANKAAIWHSNHLLLLPSRWEGCSYAMVEALLCGRPVLRTNYGGVAEWIRDGVNGFVCPAPEPNLLAQTLATAWSRRHEWREMGVAAHAHASALVDPEPEAKLLAVLDA